MDQLDPQQLLPESSDPASSLKTERDFRWTDTLAALADPSLDPLFWRAERLGAESGWWEHVPFAHWIVCATSPRVLVELGTHTGVSYSAFCHAVARAGIGTRCHAVDTWQGDPHAGRYGPEVLNELRAFHDERFGAFSTLLQCTFDEGRVHIEDGSIDLLHIDGLHTYEAVRHDFESWLPKLSDRAVVLFHDINVRRDDFAVWRLWAELREQYPAFDFLHGHGLGVLAVGGDTPTPVAALCKLTDPAAIAMIRTRFARLGEHWWIDTRERLLARSLSQHAAAADAYGQQLRAELAQRDRALAEAGDYGRHLQAELAQRSAEAETARRAAEGNAEQLKTRISEAEQALAGLRQRAEAEANAARAQVAEPDRALAEARSEQARLRYELDDVLRSTFWRITAPARRAASLLPPGLRRQGRRGARLAYWVLTPHRTRERIAYFRARRAALRRPGPLTVDPPATAEPASAKASSLARFFDADWYVGRYGDVNGTGLTPFEHFLIHGATELRDPNPAFDTAWYYEAYPDVRREGLLAFEHFTLRGAAEGRPPFRDFDFDFYRAQASIQGASNLEAYRHYLQHGRALDIPTRKGRTPVTPRSDGVAKNLLAVPTLDTLPAPLHYGKALYLKRCELAEFRVRTSAAICFPRQEEPFVSVIIPVFNKFNYNIRVLELLEHAVCYTNAKKGVGIEVVVIDDGSTDETARLDNYVKGIVLRRTSSNIGFLRACNLGASLASAAYLVFLNNDVEFEPDIFVRLHEAIERDKADVACFGGAILQFDGSIQDLGSGIWRDGVAQGYFRNEPPTRYAYAYPRDVDYVAGCFFCIAAAEFREFGGFDECFSPGYYEETDLSLRLWQAGRRSRVYPDIRLYHLEYGTFSSEDSQRSQELMTRNRPIFVGRHQELLNERPEFQANAGYSVRHRDNRPRILFIEDRVPALPLGSGFGRSELIVRALLEVADVDIFACFRKDDDLLPENFEYIDITYGPDANLLEKRLSSRHYDVVYICRPHNLARLETVLRAWRQGGAKIVYDTEAIFAVRDVARAERGESYAAITGNQRFAGLIEEEFRPAEFADVIIAVNDIEAAIVRRHLRRPVLTMGHFLPVHPAGGEARGRFGLLFVGALPELESPNYDSLIWFVDHVWPRIRVSRPEETLRIAGYIEPEVSLDRLRRDGVICLGSVRDLADEYARARIFIAPTRFAAGVPFKVHEAFSYGLPVVGSRLIGEQLAHGGKETDALLAATVNDDGEEFAGACLALLNDDQLWLEKHEAAIAYINTFCAPSALRGVIDTLLSQLGQRPFTGVRSGMDLRDGRAPVHPITISDGSPPEDETQPGSVPVSNGELRCLKMPSFGAEAALFATHSPDGALKLHVLHYIESLRQEGISVVLVVNSDEPFDCGDPGLLSRVDGLFTRRNKGFDFGAWAHVIKTHDELLDASILYLINDSVIGPVDQTSFKNLLERLRGSEADVIGLTESLQLCWHLQSFFLAFKRRALLSAAFKQFLDGVVCYENKQDVITHYEVRLATILKAAGLECEALFHAKDALNPTTSHWKNLLDAGFPFVKAAIVRSEIPEVEANGCPGWSSGRGLHLSRSINREVQPGVTLERRAGMLLAPVPQDAKNPVAGAAFRPASGEIQNLSAGSFAELAHPPGHHYSPIVNVSEIADEFRRRATEPTPATLDGILVDLAEQRNLWLRMVPLFKEIPFRPTKTPGFRYYFDNENYSYGDGSVLYAMLRLNRPKRLIEVGSGYSSACSMDTIEHYLSGEVKVTFIDPYPQLLRDMLGEETIRGVTLHEQRVQDIPLALFDTLESGDILFIDSTHVIKTGSDVCQELFDIIPRLAPGVLVHFHDMFWPFEYPEDWVLRENRSWNELYGMRAFLMYNATLEIVFFNDYFRRFDATLIRETYPLFLTNPGGSLWLRKV
jgi:O-antigen biosynthesis protein